MRILSMLAKGSGTGIGGKKKEDTFGMKDEDWDIYKTVSKVKWPIMELFIRLSPIVRKV